MSHAQFSPSGASRWMTCPASLALEAGLPDKSGPDADYGTDAHELAALCLQTNADAKAHLGKRMTLGNVVDAEMADAVQVYLDTVRKIAEPGQLLVEQSLPLDHVTGEIGAKGTSDSVILLGDELCIVDLKMGRGVRVDAQDNPQLKLYALGALREYDGVLGEFSTVRMMISQPRLGHVSEELVTVAELQEFASKAKDCAMTGKVVLERKRFGDAPLPEHYGPSEKGCKFCRAKATCPALAKFVAEGVGADFDVIVQEPAAVLNGTSTLPDPDLATAMAATDLIEDWCKAVRAEVERRLLAGTEVPGYKLVEGRRGARSWTDPAAAEEMLVKQFRLKTEEAYNLSLISPTSAEKLAKAEVIGPRQWTKVQALIVQPNGKPSVAPVSDKRPALVMTPVADDFTDIASTGEDLV